MMPKCRKCHLRETKFEKFPGWRGMPLDPPRGSKSYFHSKGVECLLFATSVKDSIPVPLPHVWGHWAFHSPFPE